MHVSFPRPLLRQPTSWLFTAALLTSSWGFGQTASQAPRVWTNQEGRSVTASLVQVSGGTVVIQLPDGSRSNVAVSTLSKADQDYLHGLPNPGRPAAGDTASGALVWPASALLVDPKTVVVTEGRMDTEARRYHYEVGNFEFISTARLAGSVMAQVATDFLVTEKFFVSMPWNSTPKPKKGDRFIVYMAETNGDYLALGGDADNASEMVDDNCLIRFSALGLEKVGARYQYDPRKKEPGRVTGIVAYGMLYDVRGWLMPWTSQGLANFLRFVAYQNNGSVRFSDLGISLRQGVKDRMETSKITLSLSRVLKYMRATNSGLRANSLQERLEQQMDCFVVLYYFGFLDGDGSGEVLHQYYRNVFARSRRSQSPEEAQAMLKASGMENASPEDMMAKLLAGRDDATLGAQMTEKFKAIGVKFDP